MGIAFSSLIYVIYVLLTLSCVWAYSKNHFNIFVITYLSLLHINVTSFSNIGIAWTGDFCVMMFVTFDYLLRVTDRSLQTQKFKIYLGPTNRIILVFWLLIAVSVFTSLVREIDLSSEYGMAPFARSFKSFVKLSIYVYSALLIARKISGKIDYAIWVNALSFSGFLPCIAVFYQTFMTSSPMVLLHNNNTFTKLPRVLTYDGARGVGLSDESSFFALCLTFSFVGSLAGLAYFKGHTKHLHAGMAVLQFFAISLSLSRTGMLGIALATLVFFGQRSIKRTLKVALVSSFLVFAVNYLSVLSGVQFSLIERFSSIFNIEYSASNIERYGIAASLWSLLWTEGAIFGYGFFNYMYYIGQHFPAFMANIQYEAPEAIPSFNLFIQLLVEIGLVQFVFFTAFCVYVSSHRGILTDNSALPRQMVITVGCVVLLSAMSLNVFAFGMPFIFVILLNLRFNKV